MDGSEGVYEARYYFDRRTILVLSVSVVFVVLALLPGIDISPVLRIAGLVLFGGGGLLMAVNSLSRKTALRVDETGVLLGGAPARYRVTTAQVPWQDIRRVVLWRFRVPHASAQLYVGLERREGAPPLPTPGQGPLAQALAESLLHMPADLVLTSRAVQGWQLDKEQLAAAVQRFAPGVELLDLPE